MQEATPFSVLGGWYLGGPMHGAPIPAELRTVDSWAVPVEGGGYATYRRETAVVPGPGEAMLVIDLLVWNEESHE